MFQSPEFPIRYDWLRIEQIVGRARRIVLLSDDEQSDACKQSDDEQSDDEQSDACEPLPNITIDYACINNLPNITIDYACINNLPNVLIQWFELYDIVELNYTAHAIDYACEYGHYDILKLWFDKFKSHNIDLRYSSRAIVMICKNNHVELLELWFELHDEYDIELLYTKQAMFEACRYGLIDIIKSWVDHSDRIKLIYDHTLMDTAGEYNHGNILEFWLTSSQLGLVDFLYSTNILYRWGARNPEIKYFLFRNRNILCIGEEFINGILEKCIGNPYYIDSQSMKWITDALWHFNITSINVYNIIYRTPQVYNKLEQSLIGSLLIFIDKCQRMGLDMPCNDDAVDCTTNVDILSLLLTKSDGLKYTNKALDNAIKCNDIQLIRTWIQSGRDLLYTQELNVSHIKYDTSVPVQRYMDCTGMIGECSICLDTYAQEDTVRVMQCKHVYHIDCIQRWFDSSNAVICAYCRNIPKTTDNKIISFNSAREFIEFIRDTIIVEIMTGTSASSIYLPMPNTYDSNDDSEGDGEGDDEDQGFGLFD
jgi:hypothetical protein